MQVQDELAFNCEKKSAPAGIQTITHVPRRAG